MMMNEVSCGQLDWVWSGSLLSHDLAFGVVLGEKMTILDVTSWTTFRRSHRLWLLIPDASSFVFRRTGDRRWLPERK
jgi:hypothetical protein